MYVLNHHQGTAENDLPELHFGEGKSVESCCVVISGAVHLMGGYVPALEHFLLP